MTLIIALEQGFWCWQKLTVSLHLLLTGSQYGCIAKTTLLLYGSAICIDSVQLASSKHDVTLILEEYELDGWTIKRQLLKSREVKFDED